MRYARIGLWALPIFTLALFAGTITHQPPPQTDLGGWSAYVTTNEFLFSHIVFSIIGAAFGAIGSVALGAILVERGSIKLGLVGLITGVSAMVIGSSVFGIAAFAQPAIGRLYLSGQVQTARDMYNDAAQGIPLVVVALFFIVLIVTSFIVFGVAVARVRGMPRWAGVGYAVGGVVFAVVGFVLDNWIQSVGAVLLILSSSWIAFSVTGLPRR